MPRTLKPFHQMTEEDYAEIGLKCGLEVHQQLDTRRKLFCRCPVGQYSEEYDAEILRHMRPTLSELGEYDGTALMEKKTRKHILYRIKQDTVCTYEFDDTPPFLINEPALDIAIEMALLLRLNMIDELHIARKQYLDGSIPTGFQRTTILGIDGWIPYKGRRIGITQLGLEEDSCREVYDVGHDRCYLTDRLGTPLIETVTAPHMVTPQECAEICHLIRMLSRSTGKVRTGYGTGRQDVNVSVTGGTRIEIKGVPQITRIPRLVYNEARRQWALLGIRDKLRTRGVTPDTFSYAVSDVTGLLARTQYQLIRIALEKRQRVKCVVLRRFAGLLNEPTQEHTTFVKEFSDRVRVIACLTQLPNLVHSDNAPDSLLGREWQKLYKKTGAGHDDALLVVWGEEKDVACACEEIALRAREATEGVPRDTRQALADGTNGFERVLPGAERMYPDTDLPPLAIDPQRVQRIRRKLPQYPWDRQAQFRAMGLPADVIEPLSISPRASVFDRIVTELGVDPVLAAVVLCQRFKSFRRQGLNTAQLTDGELYELFRLFADGTIAREALVPLLRHLAKKPVVSGPPQSRVARAREELGLAPIAEDSIAPHIRTVSESIDGAHFPSAETRHRHVMGRLMADLRGRTDGRTLAERVGTALRTTAPAAPSSPPRRPPVPEKTQT